MKHLALPTSFASSLEDPAIETQLQNLYHSMLGHTCGLDCSPENFMDGVRLGLLWWRMEGPINEDMTSHP